MGMYYLAQFPERPHYLGFLVTCPWIFQPHSVTWILEAEIYFRPLKDVTIYADVIMIKIADSRGVVVSFCQ